MAPASDVDGCLCGFRFRRSGDWMTKSRCTGQWPLATAQPHWSTDHGPCCGLGVMIGQWKMIGGESRGWIEQVINDPRAEHTYLIHTYTL